MKLAHANVGAACYGRAYRIPLPSTANAHPALSRKTDVPPLLRLTARWRIRPENGKLECFWSLEAASAEDPLPSRRRRRRTAADSRLRARHHR